MSYQLVFWKQPIDFPEEPRRVYEQLINGERVNELDEVQGDRFLGRVTEAFAFGWERLDEFNWERSDGSFVVEVGPQHFMIVSYSLPGDVLNDFIDIAAEFGCQLYDPQTDVRFKG